MLDQTYKIKDLGDLTYFLGLEVTRSSSRIHLSQQKYTIDILHETGMQDCASMPTHMTHSSHLSSTEGIQLNEDETSTYYRLIGKLIYLTNIRHNIAFSVNNINQFVFVPTKFHQQDAFGILRYLKR